MKKTLQKKEDGKEDRQKYFLKIVEEEKKTMKINKKISQKKRKKDHEKRINMKYLKNDQLHEFFFSFYYTSHKYFVSWLYL